MTQLMILHWGDSTCWTRLGMKQNTWDTICKHIKLNKSLLQTESLCNNKKKNSLFYVGHSQPSRKWEPRTFLPDEPPIKALIFLYQCALVRQTYVSMSGWRKLEWEREVTSCGAKERDRKTRPDNTAVLACHFCVNEQVLFLPSLPLLALVVRALACITPLCHIL